jgi:predicted TIM-barrel fold metal-dependent hydrolase
MPDYLPYLDREFRDDFRAFCKFYETHGSHNFEPAALRARLDENEVEDWISNFIDPGRLDGYWNPRRRLEEMEREGVVAEMIFPDFGLPFELRSPFLSVLSHDTAPSEEQVEAGNRAYNRWLADFCAEAPHRFGALAVVTFRDVEATLKEIRWAKEQGFRGMLLPRFDEEEPVFSPSFTPIWSLLEDLEMPANGHASSSGITTTTPAVPPLPHPAVGLPIFVPQMRFFGHQLLNHFIWGGVLERHKRLNLVITEQQSDWVIGSLRSMDFSYEGSYLRSDIREFLPHKPTEYFEQQCYLGSSLFSRAEIRVRHEIGLDKIMLGADYPHHEGTIAVGTRSYLKATLGAECVPRAEAERMLAFNAAQLWGFDIQALQRDAERIGLMFGDILSPEPVSTIVRGDVNRPLCSVD